MRARFYLAKKTWYFLLAICLLILIFLIYFKFVRPRQEDNQAEIEYRTLLNPGNYLGIVNHPLPYHFPERLVYLPTYDPHSERLWQVDLRGKDISRINLSGRINDLLYADFDDRTRWPSNLPSGFSPVNIMDLGKNPGLGIRELHAQGITGKGVGLAIIDQPLLVDHIEYKNNLRLYEEIHIIGNTVSMHGPAVASIAVGKNVGVAPEADLYFIAEFHGDKNKDEIKIDFSYLAQSIERMLAINRQLPKEKKIRAISISVGWLPGNKGYKKVMASVDKAIREGVFIVSSSVRDCYGEKFNFNGLGRLPMADPEFLASYSPGKFWAREMPDFAKQSNSENSLLVPMDSRCTAGPTGVEDYVFYRQGGWSWSIPYIAGLYALGCQVSPDLTPEVFWSNAVATADPVTMEKDGKSYKVGRIVNPLKLIYLLKNRTGD